MEFLADENFPLPSIRLLRNAGFNVKSIGEEKRGIADEHVMEIAVEEGLIILTFDRDYGELIFKYAKKAPPAVVYFRTKGARPDDAGKTLAYLIKHTSLKLIGFFTVIEENGIRQRKLM
jgi:predicted nuclease of predicted toxin-antitoxin system